jgi:hypothetical protein
MPTLINCRGQDCMLVPLHVQANAASNKAMRVSRFRSAGEYRRKVLGFLNS